MNKCQKIIKYKIWTVVFVIIFFIFYNSGNDQLYNNVAQVT